MTEPNTAALAASEIDFHKRGTGWAWVCPSCWTSTGHSSLEAAEDDAASHLANDHDRMERVPDAHYT
jgi:hypothetical protein